jgi:hypothetical protein
MVFYNVRFTLKEAVDESHGVAIVEDFLSELCAHGEARSFRVERESVIARPAQFLATIQFSDDASFVRAMKNQEERGIHRGKHGEVVRVVGDFKVEVIRSPGAKREAMQYACEI